MKKLDMEYLKSDAVGKIIAKGLCELYLEKPKFPVDFLGNWLLNYSKTDMNWGTVNLKQLRKQELQEKQKHLLHSQQEHDKLLEEQLSKTQQDEQHFKDQIDNCVFHDKMLNHFCDYLAKKVPGVYVGYVDYPRKPVIDLDETAHLDLNAPKVINYIAACESHLNFMLSQTLSLEQGVTAQVF